MAPKKAHRGILTVIGAAIVLVGFVVNDYEKENAKETKDLISNAVAGFDATEDARIADGEATWTEGRTLEAQGLSEPITQLRILPLQRKSISQLRVLLVRVNKLMLKLHDVEAQKQVVLHLLNTPDPHKPCYGADASIGCLESLYAEVIKDVRGDFQNLPQDPRQLALAESSIDAFETKSKVFNANLKAAFPDFNNVAQQQREEAECKLQFWKYTSYVMFLVGWLFGLFDKLFSGSDSTTESA
jgi:hypothetical protein